MFEKSGRSKFHPGMAVSGGDITKLTSLDVLAAPKQKGVRMTKKIPPKSGSPALFLVPRHDLTPWSLTLLLMSQVGLLDINVWRRAVDPTQSWGTQTALRFVDGPIPINDSVDDWTSGGYFRRPGDPETTKWESPPRSYWRT